MTKFYGVIGYATQEETAPGVWEDVITEVNASGDILQNNRRWEPTENLNADVIISNKFSVISHTSLETNLSRIRYIKWMGERWKISSLEIKRPRIIISAGGVYNGPIPN